jgi:TetR/AcrR family fatty acid metabolism transcriptional regulator
MSKRNAILAAATRLFSRKGFRAPSMAELSKATGAAGGTIFHHFKNKEDLFLNMLRTSRTILERPFRTYQKNPECRNGLEMVEGAVAFYLPLTGHAGRPVSAPAPPFPYEMAETNPVCRSCLESIYNCLLDILKKVFGSGQQDGSVKTRIARNTAMVMFAMVDGIVRLNTYRIYTMPATLIRQPDGRLPPAADR